MKTRMLAIGLVLPLLAGCGVRLQGIDLGNLVDIGKKATTNAENMSVEQEQAIGEKITAVLLGAGTLDPDQKLQRYVNRVGKWVALQGERPALNWSFVVMDSRDVNAFAAPGGYIIVTSGLLESLSSEAELAGVLAHEIAHVDQKHHLKALEANKNISLAGDLAVLAGQVYGTGHPTRSRHSYRNQKIAEKLLSATQDLYMQGLRKEDEFDADRRALVLMARAGYSPYAFISVLQRLESIQPNDSHLALLFATHPPAAERLIRIAPTLEKLEQAGVSGHENRRRLAKFTRH